MKTFWYLCLVATFALSAGFASPVVANGPQCPSGTSLIAKFEWNGSRYVFEKPSGNQHIVSLSGNARSATWSSQADVSAIVLKGARDSEVIATTNPRAGSFTNANLETPSGQTADISNVQFCAGSTPPPPPPPPGGDCVECGFGADDANKVSELTLEYSGAAGFVRVYNNDKVRSNELLFEGYLDPGDTFTIAASTIGKDEFSSKVGFYVDGTSDGDKVAEIHTSCSSPVGFGTTEANQPKGEDPNGVVDFTVLSGKDGDGNDLCDIPPPPPPPPGGDCVECGYGDDDGEKAAILTLDYSGDAGIVTVYRSNKVEPGERLFSGYLEPGDTFTIDASSLGKDDLGSKVGFYLDGAFIAEIHTSCSDVLGIGTTEANQEKGKDPNDHVDFTVVSGRDKNGDEYCDIPPPPPPPPPPGGDCVECGFGENDANRIGELTLRYLGPDAYVTVYDHKVSNGDILFEGQLTTGQIFTVFASTIGEDRIGPKILLFAGGVQLAEIHTSCSAPITAGLTEQTQPKAKDPNGVADFEIVGGRDSRGKELCGSDVCAVDQGPPQIRYSFETDRFVVVTVTDDTGIATIDIELEDVGGDPMVNLELVESDFTPGAMTARFKYRLINFTQNTFIRVVATDLCDQRQCPDTDQFPNANPFVSITGQGDFATGLAFHVDGLQSLEFFRLNNVTVTQNTFVQGNPRADFTVTRLDPAQAGTYGLIAASKCNATVIDPDLNYSGTGARGDIGMASLEVGSRSMLDALLRGDDAASEATALPGAFAIGQNYPNPFRTSTSIGVELPEATEVLLEVYNLLGQRVAIVVDGFFEAGVHTFGFDARDLPSGTYIYRVVTPESASARRMVILN